MTHSYQEKNDFSLNELSLIEAPKRKKGLIQKYKPIHPLSHQIIYLKNSYQQVL